MNEYTAYATNNPKGITMFALYIYKSNELIDTIAAETEQKCLELADAQYPVTEYRFTFHKLNKEITKMNYKLDIYKVIDGTDDWPIVDTIHGETPDDCDEMAESQYGSNDEYHWTCAVENN